MGGKEPKQRDEVTAIVPEIPQKDIAIFVSSLSALVVVWAVFSNVFDLTEAISSPALVAAETYALVNSGEWVVHVFDTTRRVVYGFLFTIFIGTILGIAMGVSKFWRVVLQDYITVGLALPSLFAAVFAAMAFGLSDITPVVAGAVISFPFVTQGIYEGVKDIDNDLIEMADSFDVSRRRVIVRIIVRGVMPEWFAGARYAFAICWKITTLAELIVATSGVGYVIRRNMDALDLTGVIVWTLLFTVLVMLIEYGVFRQLEKRVFAWRQETTVGWS